MKWELVLLLCHLGMESFLGIDLNYFKEEGIEGGEISRTERMSKFLRLRQCQELLRFENEDRPSHIPWATNNGSVCLYFFLIKKLYLYCGT